MADIIVFDGVCHLCNGWVQFLLRHDRRQHLRFAPMQGETGRRLLAEHGIDPDDPVSFLYFSEQKAFTDTDGIIRVLVSLGGVWKLAVAGQAVPRFLRDPVYRLVARNRYRLFGRRAACSLPKPEVAARFLP